MVSFVHLLSLVVLRSTIHELPSSYSHSMSPSSKVLNFTVPSANNDARYLSLASIVNLKLLSWAMTAIIVLTIYAWYLFMLRIPSRVGMSVLQ